MTQSTRPNPFDALIDNAVAAAATESVASSGGRPSFRKGKKRGGRGAN